MRPVFAIMNCALMLAYCGCAETRDVTAGGSSASRRENQTPPLLSGAAPRFPDAVLHVSAKLQEEGEDPSEFHAEVEEKDGGAVLVFRLAHKNTFLPKNRNVIGNPSGKDREIIFDTRTRKASQSLFYQ